MNQRTMMTRVFIHLLVLCGLCSVGSLSWAGVNCDLCGQSIEGRYFEYNTSAKHLTVCVDCNRKNPHCDACKLPCLAAQLKNVQGEKLCTDCAAHALFCSLCKKRIDGQYFKATAADTLYCARCYSSYPRCTVCGVPTAAANLDPVSNVCKQCLPKVPRCTACSKPIVGSYYEFNHAEGTYCEDCKLTRAKCHVCGVPVGKKYWRYPDGRTVCLQCNERAVIDESRIRQIMAEVEGLVTASLGLKVEKPYILHVEALNNNSFLQARKAKEGHASGSPLTGSELGLFRMTPEKMEIFLLYGLPVELIYETAAHEFTHAWQAENCPLNQADEVREGFAQWVAAQILKQKGYTAALEKLEARNDRPYGSGYQRMKKVEENLGRPLLLEYVKKTIH